jgi:branched-chain amino acid transport system ATP-binding protein
MKDIVSGYGKLVILQHVSWQVDEGEILSIIGPNGCGKSTLLKSIFGIADVHAGSIYFEGIDITRRRPDKVTRLGISYVPQIDNTFSNLTVQENLEMGAYIRNDRSSVMSDIEEILERFPSLKQRRKLKANTLSGGERQMLAIARGLMIKPKLFLIDEITHGLAPIVAKQMLEKICEIRESAAVVMVEQNVKEALQISDRACVLVQGRKVLEGNAHEILENQDLAAIFLGKQLSPN